MGTNRKVFSTGLKLFDLVLMTVAFFVATLPLVHRVGRLTLTEFFSMRVKLGNIVLFACFLMVLHILFSVFGLYHSKRMSSRWEEVWDIAKSTTAGTLIIAGCAYVFQIWVVNRIFLAIFWLLTTGLVILSRVVIRLSLAYARRHGRNTRNLLVIGTNARALSLVEGIQARPELGYRILGFADENWRGLDKFKELGHTLVADFESLPAYLRR